MLTRNVIKSHVVGDNSNVRMSGSLVSLVASAYSEILKMEGSN